jgi:asparagine synthase (glutamine-hydrolysing)
LVERIQSLGNGGDSSHPWHPEAMASFTSPIWQSHFADFDFLETLGPVVWRHPYLDVRVLEYLLSVPPVPWGWKKQLVREAMRGRLPPELLAREKTPVPRDIMDVMKSVRFMPEFMAKGPLAAFVDVRQISEAAIREVMAWPALSVFVLDHWLALQRP